MLEGIYKYIRELAPFKLEFIDENDNYYMIDSYIKSLNETHILISPPEKDGHTLNILDNAEVNLVFSIEKGILIAQCTVLGKELGTSSGIKVSFPHETRVQERREYIRVPVKLKTEVICYLDELFNEKTTFFAITKNVSASGLAFYHREPIENAYNITCKLYMDDENPKPVEVDCNVVYSQKVKIKDELIYMTAIEYRSISDTDCARIVKECFKYQVKQKKVKNN